MGGEDEGRTIVQKQRTMNGSEGYITDFLLTGYFGTFYLKNFNINAQNADPIRYNAVQSNFMNGDVDVYLNSR